MCSRSTAAVQSYTWGNCRNAAYRKVLVERQRRVRDQLYAVYTVSLYRSEVENTAAMPHHEASIRTHPLSTSQRTLPSTGQQPGRDQVVSASD